MTDLERETREWLAWAEHGEHLPAISDPASLLSRWLAREALWAKYAAMLRAHHFTGWESSDLAEHDKRLRAALGIEETP